MGGPARSTSSTSPSELGSDPQVLRARIAELQRECADLHRAQQIHRGAGRVLESLTAGAPLDEVLHILIDTIEAVTPTMLGSVFLLEDNGRRLRLGAAPRLPDFYNEAIDGLAIGPAVGSCGTCAHTGERIIVEDVMTHPYWADLREIAQRAGLRACWSHPIVSLTGGILGTFAMYYRRPQRPDASDLELLTFAAHLAGMAIERARTEAALTSSEQRLRALVQNAPMCIYEVD
ncbi:MAG: GAF domain-containing protein [Planctomycetes bacterium]|nr:GAF domain-containing protein [Planctomycetota bacterium]